MTTIKQSVRCGLLIAIPLRFLIKNADTQVQCGSNRTAYQLSCTATEDLVKGPKSQCGVTVVGLGTGTSMIKPLLLPWPYKASDPSVSSLLALPPNGSENWTLMARTLSGILASRLSYRTRHRHAVSSPEQQPIGESAF